MRELSTALTEAEADPAIKVVVLQGADHAFSVGYDITQEVEMGVSTADAAVLNSAHTPEREEFTNLVATQGLGAALAWRDERYGAVDS